MIPRVEPAAMLFRNPNSFRIIVRGRLFGIVLKSRRISPAHDKPQGERLMTGPRISYVDPAAVTDPDMLAEFDRCAR
jgi:hypothetical protein